MEHPQVKAVGTLAWTFCFVCIGINLFSCSDARSSFIGSRIQDTCDGQWPVCNTVVGCLIGEKSYVAGLFPGKGRASVQVFEPSTVTLSIYLENVTGSGKETLINFYEDGCSSRQPFTLAGKDLMAEFDKLGVVQRSADLTGVGDHLLEWESDSSGRYLVKVDVVPTRLSTPSSP